MPDDRDPEEFTEWSVQEPGPRGPASQGRRSQGATTKECLEGISRRSNAASGGPGRRDIARVPGRATRAEIEQQAVEEPDDPHTHREEVELDIMEETTAD